MRDTVKVTIPIEAELSKLKAQLSGLKKDVNNSLSPNAENFKQITSLLTKMEQKFSQIEIASKGTFTSQSQFTSLLRQIHELENESSVLADNFQSLELRDFNIDLTDLNRLKKDADDAKKKLEELQSDKIEPVINDASFKDVADSIKKFGIKIKKDMTFNDLSDNFKNTSNTIAQEITTLQTKLRDLQTTQQNLGKFNTAQFNSGLTNIWNAATKRTQTLNDPKQNAQYTLRLLGAGTRFNLTTNEMDYGSLNKQLNSSANMTEWVNTFQTNVSTSLSKLINDASVNLSKAYATGTLKKDGTYSNQKTIDKYEAQVARYRNAEVQLNTLVQNMRANMAQYEQDIGGFRTDINTDRAQVARNTAQYLANLGINLNKQDLELRAGETQADYEARINTAIAQIIQSIAQDIQAATQQITNQTADKNEAAQRASDVQNIATARQNAVPQAAQAAVQAEIEANTALQQAIQTTNDMRDSSVDSIHDFGDAASGMSRKVEEAGESFDILSTRMARLQNIKGTVSSFLGFNHVLNLTRNAVINAWNSIKELDSVMTEIAVVTNMTQSELWGQIDTYTAIAKQFGVETKGVYEISMLYYQQGLSTSEVMAATTETLKMAKIAGLDYATATDYKLIRYVA